MAGQSWTPARALNPAWHFPSVMATTGVAAAGSRDGPEGWGRAEQAPGQAFHRAGRAGKAAPRPVTHQAAPPDGRGAEDRIALFFQPGEALGDPI